MQGMTGMDVRGEEGQNAGCSQWMPWANGTEGVAATACEDT
jgi:hypothetical protein